MQLGGGKYIPLLWTRLQSSIFPEWNSACETVATRLLSVPANLITVVTSYEWSHTTFFFFSLVYFISILSSKFLYVAAGVRTPSLLGLSNNPSCVCRSRSTPLCVHTWVVSTFWLLWLMLLWTWVWTYLSESLVSNLLNICLEVEFQDPMAILCLIVWGMDRFNSSLSVFMLFHLYYIIYKLFLRINYVS